MTGRFRSLITVVGVASAVTGAVLISAMLKIRREGWIDGGIIWAAISIILDLPIFLGFSHDAEKLRC
jgi:hypothetical protein